MMKSQVTAEKGKRFLSCGEVFVTLHVPVTANSDNLTVV